MNFYFTQYKVNAYDFLFEASITNEKGMKSYINLNQLQVKQKYK